MIKTRKENSIVLCMTIEDPETGEVRSQPLPTPTDLGINPEAAAVLLLVSHGVKVLGVTRSVTC